MFTPGRLPQLVVFDLDYTCWDLYCDTHVSPPIKRKDDREINLVYDRYNTPMSFYPELPDILVELHNKDVKLALASRTSAIKCANQALTELLVPAPVALRQRQKVAADGELVSAIRLFDPIEIYVGSKLKHFKAIHEKTGIPYNEMIFFDDEPRNREVGSLGVHFVLVTQGVTKALVQKGLLAWRSKVEQ